MKEIKKAIGAFDVAENITDIGAVREQRVDDFDEFSIRR